LTLAETAAYIAFRIRTAGGEASRLFTREAVTLIHESAKGIPRVVSVICDNALLSGFALGRKPISSDVVSEVLRDFDISRTASAEPNPEPTPDSIPSVPGQLLVVAPAAAAPPPAPAPPRFDSPAGEMFQTARPRRRFSLFG
jgi:hypothetical protein